MKLIKYIHIVSQLITVGLLFLIYFVFLNIFYPAPKDYPDHVVKTLYIDRKFSNDETQAIMEAAYSWSSATDYIVTYNIVKLPAKSKIDYSTAIIIVKMSPDDPNVMLLDGEDGKYILGYYTEALSVPYIAIVPDNIENYDMYYTVVLHELGHSLGLKHDESENGFGTLMYPTTQFGSTEITKRDLENFCLLYHCNASKL